ncbi:MAG: phosphatidylserine decarboxylase proenzyme [Burkholderiaceae bacterium]|nr:MAG: phosphatidylserine decarboxylase proenzyme [Burkholderiaceae bacterium]
MSVIDVQNYPHPFFAREGWPFIAISLLVFLALLILDLFFGAFLALILSIFTFQFFRDPKRSGPNDDSVITSPADGRVIFIGKSLDPLQNIEALKISVFMNVFNVHSNRSPIEGTIKSVDYQSGNFFNADLDKASEQNERNSVLFVDKSGRRLTCIQIAGLVARRICCYVSPGDTVQRGARFGFIRFGSRVDVYLPVNARPLVTVGDKILAHSSAIANWP